MSFEIDLQYANANANANANRGFVIVYNKVNHISRRKRLTGLAVLLGFTAVAVLFYSRGNTPEVRNAAFRQSVEMEAKESKAASDASPPELPQDAKPIPEDGSLEMQNILKQIKVTEAHPPSRERDTLLKDLGDSWKSNATAEEEKKRILDEVAKESIGESAQKLLKTFLSPHFTPYHTSQPDFRSAFDMVDDLKKDPRVAKLLMVIENGTEEEKNLLYNTLLEQVDYFLKGLPEKCNYDAGVYHSIGQLGVGEALPVLLAAFPPSVENLQLIVEMKDRYMTSQLESLNSGAALSSAPPPDSFIVSSFTQESAFSSFQILQKLMEESPNNDLKLNEEQMNVLREYEADQASIRLATLKFMQGETVQNVAGDNAASHSYSDQELDQIYWQHYKTINQLSGLLGKGGFGSYEREILAYSQRIAELQ